MRAIFPAIFQTIRSSYFPRPSIDEVSRFGQRPDASTANSHTPVRLERMFQRFVAYDYHSW